LNFSQTKKFKTLIFFTHLNLKILEKNSIKNAKIP
jgi:hypothetical protein